MMHKCLDPDWKKFAASFRDGEVYVKMPVAKARALLLVWEIISPKLDPAAVQSRDLSLLTDLLPEETKGSQEHGIKSVFYVLPPADCRRDIELSQELLEPFDATGVFKEFRETLERGLKNDPQVDWISRVGGPKRDPLAGLERESEEPSNLFDFDFEDLTI